jgi:uncharacterized membrane protein YphA (DoxX/SURF4 family)
MDALLLVARLVLAAVFTVAALSKLADRGDFTVREFWIRSRTAAGPLSVLIPLGEPGRAERTRGRSISE